LSVFFSDFFSVSDGDWGFVLLISTISFFIVGCGVLGLFIFGQFSQTSAIGLYSGSAF
jgi:hypothetical protein